MAHALKLCYSADKSSDGVGNPQSIGVSDHHALYKTQNPCLKPFSDVTGHKKSYEISGKTRTTGYVSASLNPPPHTHTHTSLLCTGDGGSYLKTGADRLWNTPCDVGNDLFNP